MRISRFMAVLIMLALVLPAAPAHAGGIVHICNEANLKTALTGGGTVTFACDGTIALTSTITIAQNTTIDGTGRSVTISGEYGRRVFTVNPGVTLTLNGLTVANGSDYDTGGGGVLNNGTLTVSHTTFSGNRAGRGGGVLNNGTLTVSHTTFSGNDAGQGGGIFNDGGSVTVSNSSFSDISWDLGAGIYNRDGTLTVNNSSFSGNHTYWFGGGIFNINGTVAVRNSTFFDNRAFSGGGIYTNGGVLTVSNSTFAGNGANEYGGGIENNGGTATVSNCTISGNRAFQAGGGIHNSGKLTLANTIVANSLKGKNCAGNRPNDGGGNLRYPAADTSCPGIPGDPVLGPLQDNGGPTQTMALLPGSAALNAADNAICAAEPVNNLDQRGATRLQGAHCDIGAFEASLVVVTDCQEKALKDALALAGAGDIVSLACDGPIVLSSTIAITDDTMIDGSAQNVTISGNDQVGVFTVNPGSALNLGRLTVAHGSTYVGGGIYSEWGRVTVTYGAFSGNRANNGPGGGIYSYDGTVTVSHSTFSDNSTPEGGGGGIYSGAGTLTVSDSTFSRNSAAEDGGGICSDYAGVVIVSASTFAGNHAYRDGGGIYSGNPGMLTLSNSTFAGNNAYRDGGGIYNRGAATVSNCTVFGNGAHRAGGGGGIHNSGALTLANTIVANSLEGQNCAGNRPNDGGGNLRYPVDDTSCPGIAGDPKLGPLQDNGGPTQTMALSPSSAAIDAADDAICEAPPVNNLDQRGVSRPKGAQCDIGAYEVSPVVYLPVIWR